MAIFKSSPLRLYNLDNSEIGYLIGSGYSDGDNTVSGSLK